jgi:hypothetical protein
VKRSGARARSAAVDRPALLATTGIAICRALDAPAQLLVTAADRERHGRPLRALDEPGGGACDLPGQPLAVGGDDDVAPAQPAFARGATSRTLCRSAGRLSTLG